MTEAQQFADRVFFGSVLTMEDAAPTASAVAVRSGRILAVGERADIEALVGPDTKVDELGTSVLLPGFVEAHGHPLAESVLLSPSILDIRPVVVDEVADVLTRLADAIRDSGPEGVYANGWDPLLQVGLPEPTRAWLNGLADDRPVAILHNSGHSAYFNDAAAAGCGLTRDTPDPVGASYGHDANGDLDGSAKEAAAVMTVFGPAMRITPADSLEQLRAESERLNAAGITTAAEWGSPSHRAPRSLPPRRPGR